jgi:hypothetical protein
MSKTSSTTPPKGLDGRELGLRGFGRAYLTKEGVEFINELSRDAFGVALLAQKTTQILIYRAERRVGSVVPGCQKKMMSWLVVGCSASCLSWNW